MAEERAPDHQVEQAKLVGLATGLGISVVASLIVFIGLGILIDQWLDKSPVFTLIGVGVGMVAAGYQLYELVLASDSKRRNGPIGRKMAERIESRQHNKTRPNG